LSHIGDATFPVDDLSSLVIPQLASNFLARRVGLTSASAIGFDPPATEEFSPVRQGAEGDKVMFEDAELVAGYERAW
jgi:hypothetical protein